MSTFTSKELKAYETASWVMIAAGFLMWLVASQCRARNIFLHEYLLAAIGTGGMLAVLATALRLLTWIKSVQLRMAGPDAFRRLAVFLAVFDLCVAIAVVWLRWEETHLPAVCFWRPGAQPALTLLWTAIAGMLPWIVAAITRSVAGATQRAA